ncbi:MAG TPA: ABC transporter substrate-binding protein [Thermohalobaculum sp.]|nr:ABC transporter substrate-binding protein [Thermohalobaculum sp.]
MKRSILAWLAAGAIAVAGSVQAQEAPKDPEVFKIGAILAMSGKADWYGKVMSAGIQQAVEEINAEGGIDGIMLEAVIEDHKSGVAKEGVSAITRLINLHGVEAVLTSFSPPTLAIAPIADEKGILLLNGGGVSTALVGASKYLFHNRSLASDLGRAAAKRANALGLERMAQLAWKTDAGESVIAAVEPYWAELGGEVVATEFMEVGAPNIDTQIAKMRASNPDWVALWLFSPDPGLAMKKIREFGMDVPVIGIEYTDDIQKVGGRHMEGYEYTSDYFTSSDEYPWSQQFAEGYSERTGADPEFYAANYYEAVYVVAEAIRRARAEGGDYWDGARLAEMIRANPVFDSVYGGEMTFQENGVAKKRVALFRIEDGASTFLDYITPD